MAIEFVIENLNKIQLKFGMAKTSPYPNKPWFIYLGDSKFSITTYLSVDDLRVIHDAIGDELKRAKEKKNNDKAT